MGTVTATVLIETLWNVNKVETAVDNANQARFNRNIVECKYSRNSGSNDAIQFNRNIVECKMTVIDRLVNLHKCLIETLWNVIKICACIQNSG